MVPSSLRPLVALLLRTAAAEVVPVAKRLAGRTLRCGQTGALRAWSFLGTAAERVDPARCFTCKTRPIAAGGLTCVECRPKPVAAVVAPNAPGGTS